MLASLFSSRVRSKLLTAFFLSTENGMNAHALSLWIGESYGAVWKELNRLEHLGILQSEKVGKSKVFSINPRCPIAPELRSLVLKTEGFGEKIRAILADLPTIQTAYIYGSFASGEVDAKSDIDLMIIGELDLPEFSARVARMERELHRPINYSIYSVNEWQAKIAQEDPFALNISQSPKIMLIGADDDL